MVIFNKETGETIREHVCLMVEGCIRIHRSLPKKKFPPTPWFGLVISVAMTCEKTLLELQNIFNSGKVKLKNCGPRPSHYKPIFHWVVTGKEAENIACFIYPFLITKKKQAKVAIIFARMSSKGRNGKNTMKPVILHQKERLYKISKYLKTI
jgi:hypothetical protein